jgi:hypothetical protein
MQDFKIIDNKYKKIDPDKLKKGDIVLHQNEGYLKINDIMVVEGKACMFTCEFYGEPSLKGNEFYMMRDDVEFVSNYATIHFKVHTNS